MEPSENQTNAKKAMSQKQLAFNMAGAGTEFALEIAVPLLVFIKWFEPKFNPNHQSKLFMASGLLICLALSAIAVGITINNYRKKLININK